MNPGCKKTNNTSGPNKNPRAKWPWWLWIIIIVVVVVVVVLIQFIVLPSLAGCFGPVVYEISDFIGDVITVLATAASLYSVVLAVKGGEDMKGVFEKLGSLDENIFGRLETLDQNVHETLDKLDGDVFTKLDKLDENVIDRLGQLDKTVIDRLEQLDETVVNRLGKMEKNVYAKLTDLDIALLIIYERLSTLKLGEGIGRTKAGKKDDDFIYADEIDDSQRKDGQKR